MIYRLNGCRSITISSILVCLCFSGPSISQDWIYTIVDGDNLWNLSKKHLDKVTRFSQLQKINQIKDPYHMLPGSKIRVPMKWIRSNPVPAEVVGITGRATLIRHQGDPEAVRPKGQLIRLGDRIKTTPGSSVAVKFADGSVVTIHGDSLARFDHLSAHGVTGMVDSRINILKGRVDTRVKPAVGPGSRFEIHTPSAISAVRGTEYRAAVADDASRSNIEVLAGTVSVTGGNKQTLVQAGFGTQVAVGAEPIAPQKLLEPPLIADPPVPIESLAFPITWQTLPGAERYRIEWSADRQFNTLFWQQLTERNKANIPDIPDGRYSVRVRGISDVGLEGRNAVTQIELDARPQPPVPLAPSDAKVFRASTPELKWTASADARSYRLEIAADSSFRESLLVEQGLAATHYGPDRLNAPGTYYWRLTSIAPDGEVGPVGDIRSYQIKPVPDKVTPSMEHVGEEALVASWRPAAGGHRYQIQLAHDEQFRDLQLDQTITEPRLNFEAARQVRYLRVRAIAADGYQGPWGAIQRVDPIPDDSFWAVPILGLLGILLL